MATVGDGAVQGNDVAVVNVDDFGVGTDVAQDVPEHDAIVMLRLGGFAWEVLALVTRGQLGHGRRLAPRTPIASWIFTAVDPAAKLMASVPP
jgi:hypothetical protein